MKSPKLSMMARLKAKKPDPKKKPMTVEGAAARPRLDRPSRMRREDGGKVLSKEREDYAKQKDTEAEDHRRSGRTSGLVGGALLGLMGGSRLRKVAQGAGGTLLGGAALSEGINRVNAEKEASWARSGKTEEGKEDRAKGGKVCK